MALKASFLNVGNVLSDWNAGKRRAAGGEEDDHCFWRGVTCGNVSFAVVSLYGSSSLPKICISWP